MDTSRSRWHGDRMTSRQIPPQEPDETQAVKPPKDDPIPEEVHRRAEALAQAVLAMPPKPQRELVGPDEVK